MALSQPPSCKKGVDCCAPLLEDPQLAIPANSAWILSFDGTSMERFFVAKNWAAAIAFLNAVSRIAEDRNHHPDVHITNYRNVRIVLTTHSAKGLTQLDIDMARAIDTDVKVDMSPKWLREQQKMLASVTDIDGYEENAVDFNTNHFQRGLNGDFSASTAIATFAGPEGKFENTHVRDIAASKEAIVKALRLVPGATVADVGSGTGLLIPLLSEAVGPEGSVIASELSPNFQRLLHERYGGLRNVQIVENPTSRDPKLPDDGSTDVILLVDVYHHLEYPLSVLRRFYSALHRHGTLVVIDFHRDPARITSHDATWVYEHLRGDQSTFTEEIERTGFVNVEQVDIPGLPENYCLIFRKRPIPLTEPGAGWTC